MALSPRLELRQSQSLVMTPQLQQAIRLLALSNLEIEGFIAEEIDRNPLLQAGGEPSGEESHETDLETRGEVPADGGTEGAPPEADALLAGDQGNEAGLDVDWSTAEFHHDSAVDQPDGPGLRGGGGLADSQVDGIDFDGFAGAPSGLHDHLLAQAGEALDGVSRMVAEAIIAQIDAAGYFDGNLLAIARDTDVPLAEAERVLGIVQRFDPSGVGGRDLAECLAIQAREADRYDPAMARMLAHLDLLAKGAMAQLKRICGVDDEDIADMIREIRGYDPKPGLRFQTDAPVLAVVPDVFVARTGAGWRIEINAATLPRVLVDRRYFAELAAGAGAQTRAWLSECLASANWLVKALDQRQRTIVRVAQEIVKQQEGFFLRGVAHMRPLTLRQIAEAVGLHESTVSRVTSHKYLSCARGMFELKYFFSSGIQAADGGDAVSAEAVKAAIRTLIDAEPPTAILSDDTLVEALKAKGFDIARRTVAKYREAMGIGSSVQRRRQKAIAQRALAG